MKRPALPVLILAVTFVLGASAPVANAFRATTALTANDIPPVNGPNRPEEPVPLTDRVPWLIYVVLTSSSVALAWILFSLARSRMRDAPRDEDKQQ